MPWAWDSGPARQTLPRAGPCSGSTRAVDSRPGRIDTPGSSNGTIYMDRVRSGEAVVICGILSFKLYAKLIYCFSV